MKVSEIWEESEMEVEKRVEKGKVKVKSVEEDTWNV